MNIMRLSNSSAISTLRLMILAVRVGQRVFLRGSVKKLMTPIKFMINIGSD